MKYFGLAVVLALGGSCQAQNWFSVARPGAQQAGAMLEVDLDTVKALEGGGEGIIRASFDAPRSHAAGFVYRSFVATAQLDCQRRTLALTSAAYFLLPQGRGPRQGADSSGRESGMPAELVDSLPLRARQALLRAACAAAGGPARPGSATGP